MDKRKAKGEQIWDWKYNKKEKVKRSSILDLNLMKFIFIKITQLDKLAFSNTTNKLSNNCHYPLASLDNQILVWK